MRWLRKWRSKRYYERKWEEIHAKPLRDSYPDLEGSEWTVHAADGIVYVAGQDGLVQAQFDRSTAIDLGWAIYNAATNEQLEQSASED